jgi:hypothetical protein
MKLIDLKSYSLRIRLYGKEESREREEEKEKYFSLGEDIILWAIARA